jgi:hypothetical protein
VSLVSFSILFHFLAVAMSSLLASRFARTLVSPAARMVAPAPCAVLGGRAFSIKVGNLIPSVSLDKGFKKEKVNLADFTKGKKVILVGLPGAFTPT